MCRRLCVDFLQCTISGIRNSNESFPQFISSSSMVPFFFLIENKKNDVSSNVTAEAQQGLGLMMGCVFAGMW